MPPAVADLLREDKALACGYERAFGDKPGADDEKLLVDVGQGAGGVPGDAGQPAHAVRRLSATRCCRGDREAAARYPAAAQRGLKIFIGADCAAPAISGRASPTASSATSASRSSRGRARSIPAATAGIAKLARQPVQPARAGTTTTPRAPARSRTRHVAAPAPQFRRVPRARPAPASAAPGPYMHNGQLATLEDVVQHYSEVNPDRLHSDACRWSARWRSLRSRAPTWSPSCARSRCRAPPRPPSTAALSRNVTRPSVPRHTGLGRERGASVSSLICRRSTKSASECARVPTPPRRAGGGTRSAQRHFNRASALSRIHAAAAASTRSARLARLMS